MELSTTFTLPNTLFVPSLSTKLLPVGQTTKDLNCCVLMYSSFCLFQDVLTKKIFGGGLYYVDDLDHGKVHSAKSHRQGQDIWLWHYRLGHPSFNYLQHLFPTLFKNVLHSNFKCKDCILGKSHRTNYPISYSKCNTPFEIIHSDLWGPAPVLTTAGFKWFVTFIDDCTRVCWVYIVKHKKDVLSIFQKFVTLIQTQFSMSIKTL